jgi:hypothetical protein
MERVDRHYALGSDRHLRLRLVGPANRRVGANDGDRSIAGNSSADQVLPRKMPATIQRLVYMTNIPE